MTFTRTRALSVMLTASILAMTTGPLLAAESHDVCDAMRHGCTSVSALASCCCNGSDTNPSQVPPGGTNVASSPQAVSAAVVAFTMPAIVVNLVRENPDLAQPPDLGILFSDLRL